MKQCRVCRRPRSTIGDMGSAYGEEVHYPSRAARKPKPVCLLVDIQPAMQLYRHAASLYRLPMKGMFPGMFPFPLTHASPCRHAIRGLFRRFLCLSSCAACAFCCICSFCSLCSFCSFCPSAHFAHSVPAPPSAASAASAPSAPFAPSAPPAPAPPFPPVPSFHPSPPPFPAIAPWPLPSLISSPSTYPPSTRSTLHTSPRSIRRPQTAEVLLTLSSSPFIPTPNCPAGHTTRPTQK